MHEKILILDFGSQYTQLIARRIRELNVYSEIVPFNHKLELDDSIKGVILSGSPFSVVADNALTLDLSPVLDRPLLGICYGAQYLANHYGGKVMPSSKREYGKAQLAEVKQDLFTEGLDSDSQVWMSHGDTITELPAEFEVLASTASIEVAAFKSHNGSFSNHVYGIQFHPEVTHSLQGKMLLENFVRKICACEGDWTPQHFIDETVEELKEKLGNDEVLMGLSGGVDSTVGAMLLHHAIGPRLKCFFIDNGLLRKNEFEEVLESYEGMGLNVTGVDAKEKFFTSLEGLSDPEAKRKAIGKAFIEVFEHESHHFPEIKWLGQGTIYPDVIESVSVHGPSVTIKSHHNVGGLPDVLKLEIVEPLRMLFKDEVRRVGATLDIPDKILGRHPFPGPGLGIRILGDITREKVAILQEADHIFIQGLKEFDLYDKVWQAVTVLLPIKSVGVMGDERTYERTVVLRAVNSLDGMTAEWSKLPHEFLAKISSRIINNVKGINRVVYDISTKPPATIEWE
ncbi:MAG: glutamine-hydrolyzing GMP synthase [Saprospiraceae bacterium]|nr:glutamine-hydrolyzing GMP synthase [Saprospiraceae bacterium]